MHKRLLVGLAALMLAAGASVATACGGSEETDTTGGSAVTVGSETEVTTAATGEPLRIAFNAGFSGSEVYDCALAQKGIHTALEMLGNQVAGRPIECIEVDSASDPLVAVEWTRALLETDTNSDGTRDPVNFVCGPLSSASTASVTYFLGQRKEKNERIPQCSVTGQPSDNIATSNKVGFIPNGIYSSHGYYLGKYAAEVLKYTTANCIHYAGRTAEELQAGFEKGFGEGGGKITSINYVPADTIDFAASFAALQPADCTMFWVRGKGAIPFVQQYAGAGLTAPLLVPMANNYSETQLQYLNALGLGLGIVACDVYTPMLDNPANNEFIAAYQRLNPGEYPTPEAFGGWLAVMLYAEGVKAVDELKGDISDPAKVIEAMSTLSMDTPAGSITMTPYANKRTYVATRDLYIVQSQSVGGSRVAWVPIETYSQVLLGE